MADCTLVARSSSHFSRVARIYASELAVAHEFEPVFDLNELDAQTYADNPLLRVPNLKSPTGTWFGTLNVCRELARRGAATGRLLWPEDSTNALAANAHEVTLDAMNTGVVIVTAKMAGLGDDATFLQKPRTRLAAAIHWLESNLDAATATLPERQLSFLEVSSFCLLTHLEFRGLGSLDACPTLRAFCEAFGRRPAAQATPFHFDRR